jgi:alpha-beta hydrolase superfamily lysophospholipase
VPHFDDDTFPYRTWLTGQAEAALVFLHGFGEHAGLSERLAGPLNASGIDLWSVDLVGHAPAGGDLSAVSWIDALAATGRRLTATARTHDPTLPVFIAGHALGGVAAALALTREPSAWSGAVLCGTPIDPPDWVGRVLDCGEDGLARVAAGLAPQPGAPSAPTIDLVAFATGARNPLHCLGAAWFELAERFGSVSLPVLFVHGQDDPVAPVAGSRWWAKRLESARLVEFSGMRRDVLNERMQAKIAAWVVEHVPAATDAESGS